MLIVFGGLMLGVFLAGVCVCEQVHLQCRIHKRDVFGISI